MTASIKETLELKPCPFCGSAPILCDQGDGDFAVTCKECGAGSRFSDEAGDAAKAWNTRVTPASLSCGEARERIARIIRRAMIDNPTGGTSEERAAKRASIADEYATAYLADLATGCVPDEASIRADQIIMPRALVEQAHAAMLETGWHLAPAHATSGDGVIEAAVAEIEERFAAAIRAGRGEG